MHKSGMGCKDNEMVRSQGTVSLCSIHKYVIPILWKQEAFFSIYFTRYKKIIEKKKTGIFDWSSIPTTWFRLFSVAKRRCHSCIKGTTLSYCTYNMWNVIRANDAEKMHVKWYQVCASLLCKAGTSPFHILAKRWLPPCFLNWRWDKNRFTNRRWCTSIRSFFTPKVYCTTLTPPHHFIRWHRLACFYAISFTLWMRKKLQRQPL